MSTYQCSRCNHKFIASSPAQCPNCMRTSAALSAYRTQDDIDFWVTTFILLPMLDDSSYGSSSSVDSTYDTTTSDTSYSDCSLSSD